MINVFYDIVCNLKTKKEVIGFFIGLLTPSEAIMFARRIQVAQLLLEQMTREQIQKQLGVGLSTINNVEHWLFSENNQFKKQIEAHMKRELKRRADEDRFFHEKHIEKYPEFALLKKLIGL